MLNMLKFCQTKNKWWIEKVLVQMWEEKRGTLEPCYSVFLHSYIMAVILFKTFFFYFRWITNPIRKQKQERNWTEWKSTAAPKRPPLARRRFVVRPGNGSNLPTCRVDRGTKKRLISSSLSSYCWSCGLSCILLLVN